MDGEMLNILLVEDNEDHAELVRRNFEEHCVANRITWVKDGNEAVEYLFRQGAYSEISLAPAPHLILLDLRLPKLDGIEVLMKIKQDEKLRLIPVVVLTSSESEKDLMKAYEHNVNSYLVKPVDFIKFTKLMKDLGYYWLGWNRHPRV